MKALTIRQPWASLIASGRKTIELRTWQTDYRGPLVITSSKTMDPARLRYPNLEQPMGVSVCMARLVGIRAAVVGDLLAACSEGEAFAGLYSWLLRDVQRLEPMEVRGQLSLWEIDQKLVRLSA